MGRRKINILQKIMPPTLSQQVHLTSEKKYENLFPFQESQYSIQPQAYVILRSTLRLARPAGHIKHELKPISK